MTTHLEGFVGIYWAIRDSARGIVLVTDRTPVTHAEPYGDCLTHSIGHYEYWEYLRRYYGKDWLAHRGLPLAIKTDEYEEWPRGRIVYDAADDRFVIYIDRKLQSTAIVERIAAAFNIPPGAYVCAFDSHYQSTKSVQERGTVAPWWIAVTTDQYRETFHFAAAGTRAEAQANLQGANAAVHSMTNQLSAEVSAASVTSSQGIDQAGGSAGVGLLTGFIMNDEI